MPWSNNTISLIILEDIPGQFSGFFAYSPFPGTGNLILSLTANAGTDPYGNVYFGGMNAYSGNTPSSVYTEILSGNVRFGIVSDGGIGSGGSINLVPNGSIQNIQLASPEPIAVTDDIILALGQYILAGTDSQGLVPETWHSMVMQNSFVLGTPSPIYRLSADGYVDIEGAIVTPGGTAAYNNVTFATLGSGLPNPSAYYPATMVRWNVNPVSATGFNATFPGFPRAIIQAGVGAITLSGIQGGLNGTTVDISGRYPL